MGGTDKNRELILGRTMLEWSVAAMPSPRSVRHVVVVTRG